MSFVFYDTETTGTQTAFDQILQFAAIKTDDDLNELDRFEIRCRLMPYIVPSPGALRVTGGLLGYLTLRLVEYRQPTPSTAVTQGECNSLPLKVSTWS